MSKARQLADLLDASGDVSVDALDNVPPSNDASALTTGTLPVDRVPYVGRRNLLINGDFRVAQRGTTFTQTNNAYHLDRWLLQNTHDVNQQITQSTDVPSNQGFKNSIKWEVYGSVKTGNSEIRQKVEDTEVANGRDVTLSFWAKADTANLHFVGIGDNVNSTVVTITNTEWTRYTITKTAVNSSSVLDVIIYAVGQGEAVGSSLWITGVQLELGSVATPFEHRSYGEELALCQRYYYKYPNNVLWGLYVVRLGSTYVRTHVTFPQTMRAVPSISNLSYDSTSGSVGAQFQTTHSVTLFANPTLGGQGVFNGNWEADAEL